MNCSTVVSCQFVAYKEQGGFPTESKVVADYTPQLASVQWDGSAFKQLTKEPTLSEQLTPPEFRGSLLKRLVRLSRTIRICLTRPPRSCLTPMRSWRRRPKRSLKYNPTQITLTQSPQQKRRSLISIRLAIQVTHPRTMRQRPRSVKSLVLMRSSSSRGSVIKSSNRAGGLPRYLKNRARSYLNSKSYGLSSTLQLPKC